MNPMPGSPEDPLRGQLNHRLQDYQLAIVGRVMDVVAEPLHAVSEADVRRQWIEMRELVHDAIPFAQVLLKACPELPHDKVDDWLLKAQVVAR